MKARMNDKVGYLLYPIEVGRPVYLFRGVAGGIVINGVDEILEEIQYSTIEDKLVTEFKVDSKIYKVEYL